VSAVQSRPSPPFNRSLPKRRERRSGVPLRRASEFWKDESPADVLTGAPARHRTRGSGYRSSLGSPRLLTASIASRTSSVGVDDGHRPVGRLLQVRQARLHERGVPRHRTGRPGRQFDPTRALPSQASFRASSTSRSSCVQPRTAPGGPGARGSLQPRDPAASLLLDAREPPRQLCARGREC
jgi:hypothetical protein